MNYTLSLLESMTYWNLNPQNPQNSANCKPCKPKCSMGTGLVTVQYLKFTLKRSHLKNANYHANKAHLRIRYIVSNISAPMRQFHISSKTFPPKKKLGQIHGFPAEVFGLSKTALPKNHLLRHGEKSSKALSPATGDDYHNIFFSCKSEWPSIAKETLQAT